MPGAVSLVGILVSVKRKSRTIPFNIRNAVSSIRLCIGQILLTLIVILCYFLGISLLPRFVIDCSFDYLCSAALNRSTTKIMAGSDA